MDAPIESWVTIRSNGIYREVKQKSW